VKIKAFVGILAMLCGSLASSAQSGWQQKVKEEMPLLGHRDWIVIVDSAYPLQSSPGIKTIETDADHLAVLNNVLDAIKNSKHVRPLVHLDKELEFVPEKESPGVELYRKDLKERLDGLPVDSDLHQA
jgi:hypothetical protein